MCKRMYATKYLYSCVMFFLNETLNFSSYEDKNSSFISEQDRDEFTSSLQIPWRVCFNGIENTAVRLILINVTY